MGLDRGLNARGLSSLFYEFRNTINIYTEDEKKNKKFYVSLFQKLLEGTGIIVNDVHPIGNCEQVIQQCIDDNDTLMPKLYVIDGDIYLMTTPRSEVNHLYVLDAYCIENKVIDEAAYYEAFDSLDPFHDKVQIKNLANYDTMMKEAEVPFMKLFCHMAVCREILNAYRLGSAKDVMKKGSISINMVDKKCEEIMDKVVRNSNLDEATIQNKINAKMTSYPPNRDNLLKYISGKDYLMVYIDEYTRSRLGAMSGQKKEFWKYQFLKYCNLSSLEGLKKAIIKEVEMFNNAKLNIA